MFHRATGDRSESQLTLILQNFLNGIIDLPFMTLSIIFGISRCELEVGQPTVKSLVRLHGSAKIHLVRNYCPMVKIVPVLGPLILHRLTTGKH